MKIGGVSVTKPSEQMLVLHRDLNPIVLRFRALQDMDEFDALCPVPPPPGVHTKDGFVPNPNDPSYKQVLEGYSKRKLSYMVIRTLEPSNIEWDTVDPNNPKTWNNYETDMKNAGFTQAERNTILGMVVDCNVLTEDKIKAARDSFLLGQAQAQPASSGQHTEPETTPSGPPAPASA